MEMVNPRNVLIPRGFWKIATHFLGYYFPAQILPVARVSVVRAPVVVRLTRASGRATLRAVKTPHITKRETNREVTYHDNENREVRHVTAIEKNVCHFLFPCLLFVCCCASREPNHDRDCARASREPNHVRVSARSVLDD